MSLSSAFASLRMESVRAARHWLAFAFVVACEFPPQLALPEVTS